MTILEYLETQVYNTSKWLWRLASEVLFLHEEEAALRRRAYILSAQVEGAHFCVVLLDGEDVLVKTYELDELHRLIIASHVGHHNPGRVVQILDYRIDKVEGSFEYTVAAGPYPGRNVQWVEQGWVWM